MSAGVLRASPRGPLATAASPRSPTNQTASWQASPTRSGAPWLLPTTPWAVSPAQPDRAVPLLVWTTTQMTTSPASRRRDGRATFSHTLRDDASSYTAPVVGTENNRATLTYNADRQPTRVDRPDGKPNTLQYDSSGRPSVAVLANGQRTYTYDTASRLISVSTSQEINLTRTYDGWLSTGTTWAGAVPGNVTQTYDNEFRVSEIKVNGANPIAIKYDNDGLPV